MIKSQNMDESHRNVKLLENTDDSKILNPNEETHVTGGRLDYSCRYGDGDTTSRAERGLASDHWALVTEIKIQQNQRNKQSRLRLVLKDQYKPAFVE